MGLLRSILGLDDKPKKATTAEPTGTPAQPAEKPGIVINGIRPFIAFMEGMLDNLAIERIEELTLREAITRFVESKPKASEAVRGALIIQSHAEGKQVAWAFLKSDKSFVYSDNGKPVGRMAICTRLDAELIATLKGNDLLIVE